ncbi:MAG: HD domain-containing protein [Bdellovibrionota bacterium]
MIFNHPERTERDYLSRLLLSQPPAGRPYLECVHRLAARVHAGEEEGEGIPYILHPLRVALVLWEEARCADPVVLAAALLHDALEHDHRLTVAELKSVAGEEAAALVRQLTFEHKRSGAVPVAVSRIRYLETLRRGNDPLKLLKMADRLDGLRRCVRTKDERGLRKRLAQEKYDYAPLFAGVRGFSAEALRIRLSFFLEEAKKDELPG